MTTFTSTNPAERKDLTTPRERLCRRRGRESIWEIVPEYVDAVVGPEAPNWFSLDGVADAALVTDRAHRPVWQVRTAGRELFVKQWIEQSPGTRLRRLWRGPDGRGEWRAGRAAAGRRIAAVRYVAYGRGRGRDGTRCSVLISEAVPHAVTLAEAWQHRTAQHDSSPDELLDALARFVAEAHGRGFLHPDDHPRNILVQRQPAEAPALYYADLHRARVGPTVGHRDAARSLARLAQWFRRRTTRTQQLRLVRAYLRFRDMVPRGSDRAALRSFIVRIERHRQRQARRLWRKRDARIFGRNRHFQTVTVGDKGRVTLVLRFRNREAFPPVVTPDRTAAEAPAWAQDVLFRAGEPTPAGSLVAEPGNPGTNSAPLGRAARRAAARSAFRVMQALRHRDLPVAAAPALIERRGPTGRQHAVCYEDVAGARWLPDAAPAETQRRQVLDALAHLAVEMLDRGVAIRRVNRRTFAVADSPSAASSRVFVSRPTGLALRRRWTRRNVTPALAALDDLLGKCPWVTDVDRSWFARRFDARLAATAGTWRLGQRHGGRPTPRRVR